MAKHATGHPPVSLTVPVALKHAVVIDISMQQLDGFMLSGRAVTAPTGQEEQRSWSDVGQGRGEPQPTGIPDDLYV
jgi:hypothetical protein